MSLVTKVGLVVLFGSKFRISMIVNVFSKLINLFIYLFIYLFIGNVDPTEMFGGFYLCVWIHRLDSQSD